MYLRLPRRLAIGALASYLSLCRSRVWFAMRCGVLVLLVQGATASGARAEDRSIDGTGNNLANPLWGSAGSDYSREASGAHFADGISAPITAGLPSARAVSNVMMSQGE